MKPTKQQSITKQYVGSGSFVLLVVWVNFVCGFGFFLSRGGGSYFGLILCLWFWLFWGWLERGDVILAFVC